MKRKRVVLKIGTSTLTSSSNRISFAKIEDIARQIIMLRESYEFIIVTSGAIAVARQYIDLSGHTQYPDSKQALSAVGQPKLMYLYDQIFESFGMHTAQCLLTYMDFEHPKGKANTIHTINKLLEHGYVPIINENDTVANEEILLGDNDKLSALVAGVLNADLLIIASDIDGLYTANPHTDPNAVLLEEIQEIEVIKSFAQDQISGLGTGGMITKIQAAEICKEHGVEMWIVNGSYQQFILKAFNRQISFSRFIC
jgi:glutamate 5-kinase